MFKVNAVTLICCHDVAAQIKALFIDIVIVRRQNYKRHRHNSMKPLMKHELLPCMIDWGRFVKVHEVLHSVYWCTIVAEPKVKVQTIPERSGTDRAKFLDEI